MIQKKTVTINGVAYDAETGERSAPALDTNRPVHVIHKFAPHQTVPPTKKVLMDIAPMHHPAAARATAVTMAAHQPRVIKPAAIIKNEAIAEAMAKTEGRSRKQHAVPRQHSRRQRALRISMAAMAVLVLGAYLSYISMPALSTRLAAAQAGINATYPSYLPSGYRLSHPVSYTGGMVSMTFKANAGPQNYTVTQKRSDWDSSAVLANYVQPAVGQQYVATQANGLTIYTYGQSAAWVNGGILYTVSGDAPLSADQIQHIAISL